MLQLFNIGKSVTRKASTKRYTTLRNVKVNKLRLRTFNKSPISIISTNPFKYSNLRYYHQTRMYS